MTHLDIHAYWILSNDYVLNGWHIATLILVDIYWIVMFPIGYVALLHSSMIVSQFDVHQSLQYIVTCVNNYVAFWHICNSAVFTH